MQITRISPHEAAAKLAEGWVYVDVREEIDFEAGHPRGAVNVPYSRNEERFVAAVRAATTVKRVVLGCKSGIVSVHAAEMLARAGFEVLEQRAGFDGARGTFGQLEEPGWERVGLPVDREEDE